MLGKTLSLFSLCCLFSCIACAGEPWCRASGRGYSCVGVVNQSLVVPCGPHQASHYSYYYQHNNEVLLESSHHLTLTPGPADNGRVICCSAGGVDATCYRLNILYPPMVVASAWVGGVSKYPLLGAPYQLTCPLQSNPPGNYTWARRDSIFAESASPLDLAGLELFDNGRSWFVEAYAREQDGVYQCSAVNTLGESSFHNDAIFTLRADECNYGSVGMTISPGTAAYTRGSNFNLSCIVHGLTRYGAEPRWYGEGNSPLEGQSLTWSQGACQWTSVLMVEGFNKDTLFICRYDDYEETIEIRVAEASGGWYGLPVLVLLLLVVALRAKTSWSSKEPSWSGFDYDVFISAHDEMRGFVINKILQPLEAHDPPYAVCWHLRDFVPGLSINEQMSEAINKSRKIIFVFSDCFQESEFCRFELELAMSRQAATNTRCVVPLTVDSSCVPNIVKASITYMPVCDVSQSTGLAEKLVKILGNPIAMAATKF